MDRAQRPLELILARNLMSSLSTPAFLVDEAGALVFYNEAAAILLGSRFEETGQLAAEEWIARFGPFDPDGQPMELEQSPLTLALRRGRAAHASFRIRSAEGGQHEIEASALPILATDGARGGMIFFWPTEGREG